MALFGSFCTDYCVGAGAYNLMAGAVALRLIATGHPRPFHPSGWRTRRDGRESPDFGAITAAAFALVWAALPMIFSITYITEHSNRALPLGYKFSALWSGQEGSLVLWAWLLGRMGCAAADA